MRHYVDNRINSRANQTPQRGGDETISLSKYHYLSCLLHYVTQLCRLQTSFEHKPMYRQISTINYTSLRITQRCT